MRKKREIEAGGREEKSPRIEEDSPGVTEEVLYMNQPNPPLANKMQKMPQQKVQTDDATVWLEKNSVRCDRWGEFGRNPLGRRGGV